MNKFYLWMLIPLLAFITSCSQELDDAQGIDAGVNTSAIDIKDYVFAVKTFDSPKHETKAVLSRNGWEQNEEILIGFLNGSDLAKNRVKEVAKEWGKLINLKFTYTTNISEAYVKIGFKYNGDRVNWSYLGTDCLNEYGLNQPTMNLLLNDVNSTTEINSADFAGIILREFGHMLGLVNEHQGSNSTISIDRDKALSYFRPFGWTDIQVDNWIMKKFPIKPPLAVAATAYDENSIMAIYIPAHITTNGVGSNKFNTALSQTDKEFISSIYPRLDPDPDEYESLPKNPRTVFHYMEVWTDYQPAHGVTPADMDNWLPNQLDHNGQPNGFWYARDGVQNNWIFSSSGTHKVVDCDEISFFAQPLRQTLGRNGNQWVEGLDIRQSDLDGERMFQSKLTDLKTFMSLYGSYYPWGAYTLWGCFFPKGNNYTNNGSGFQLFTDNTRATDITDGWGIPTTDIILQLIGQLPRHHELNGTGTRWDDIRDFFFPDAATDIITNGSTSWFKLSDNSITKNISGLGLFPGGKLPNLDVRPVGVVDFGTSHVMPTFKRNGAISVTSFAIDESGLHPTGLRISSLVAYAHGGNIRYSRIKTVDELGYKLVIDEHSDKILFVSPSDPREDIPVGILRGVALRYSNRAHKVVCESYSKIRHEAEQLTTSAIVDIESY
ncbi:hypothetical protein JGH11_16375 [Dysgonomonas sp. Marseille-P4677]|uniref:hypothetical protein n=1 Tax=Dysgonomonas sp. Marseille-P4677 TaxID=2364790 RepID=UPI001914543D|nr:hypothetical protein [Dysgonomonas sp. Marseille-P4677]MBK5722452.1 hypothetical protein [Dysgonomonas sp. Marseille-P4677]